MCLSIVEEKRDIADAVTGEGEGWKVVIIKEVKEDKFFTGPYQSYHMVHQYYEFDVWNKAKIIPIRFPEYLTGFHIFTNLKDAEWYYRENFTVSQRRYLKVVHVTWRGLLARGKTFCENKDIQCLDGYLPTIVAAEMKADAPKESRLSTT